VNIFLVIIPIVVLKIQKQQVALLRFHRSHKGWIVADHRVDCFTCMVVLELRITYGQVVLLWTMVSFVVRQLEKASKCSAVV
jgi:hypothetical protein